MKMYGSRTVVKSISLQVEQGQIIGLLGPNGAGKTTTMRLLMQILKPDEGEILYKEFISISRGAKVDVQITQTKGGLKEVKNPPKKESENKKPVKQTLEGM